MNILEQIIQQKKTEVAKRKEKIPVAVLRTTDFYKRKCISLLKGLMEPGSTGIIAEYKRKSPSKGIINDVSQLEEVVSAYEQYGAAGISVLTDEQFFGGSINDLHQARNTVNRPLLRKDFMIDEYQLEEAKAMGADVILLIAAVLTATRVQQLAAYAVNLGLEVLLELHDETELNRVCDETVLVGINNRNLKTFEVNIEHSIRLAEKIPSGKIKIAESGIDAPETIALLRKNGFSGFLVGEHFMKQPSPAKAFKHFIEQIIKT